MTLLKQIKLDLQNFRYYFFDLPELNNETKTEINNLINNKLHRPENMYQIKWKAEKWKITIDLTCDCFTNINKIILLSILVKPKFGQHISESYQGFWCPKCKSLDIKKHLDLD